MAVRVVNGVAQGLGEPVGTDGFGHAGCVPTVGRVNVGPKAVVLDRAVGRRRGGDGGD